MYYTSATYQAATILSSGECTGDSRQGTFLMELILWRERQTDERSVH